MSAVLWTGFGTLALAALLKLFQPLLTGIARALVLVVKPKLSKEQRLALRRLHNTHVVQNMVINMDGGAPSHAAELRALAVRP